MKVIIAEKPSVAKNIADALNIKVRKDGYFEGQEYYITWAFGHLLELFDAKDYEEKMQIWRMDYFPFIPDTFKYKVKMDRSKKKIDTGAKKQLKCIKDLINQKVVDGVISACDYDREGQIIGDTILNYLKVKKPIYRMLLNEWTEDEVKKGLKDMVSNKVMQPLQDAGISRQHADWLIGINLTSVATLKYKVEKGQVFNIGRVLLPTLKMIYDRDIEIEKFETKPYYKLEAKFKVGDTTYEGTYQLNQKDKFHTQEHLEAIKKRIAQKASIIRDKEIVEKSEYPPPLFNLSALQGYVTSKYTGFTSDKVLSIAQSLYEKKYITYPRTASNVLDESLVDKVSKVLNTLKKELPYEEEIKFHKQSRVFNSKKVESHSAIIPTYMKPQNLGREEQLVYLAIHNRFIMQFMPIAKVEETVFKTEVEEVEGIFVTKGKVQKVLGWKKIEKETSKDIILPDLQKGAQGICESAKVTQHTTTPPKPYTEKTLLRAMETCGKQVKSKKNKSEDEVEEQQIMDAILSGFSIGTPATRAETIKKLCYTNYTVMQKKNIRCTDKGRQLIETLPIKELMDLEYTGKLEKALSDIEKGNVNKDVFMNHITKFIVQGVHNIKEQQSGPMGTGSIPKNEVKPPMQSLKAVQITKEPQSLTKESLGKCPQCGNEVVEGTKGFGCMGYKTGCRYVIWKEDESLLRYKKKVTKTLVKQILKKKEGLVKGLTTKNGTKFDAIVTYHFDYEQNRGLWDFRKPE